MNAIKANAKAGAGAIGVMLSALAGYYLEWPAELTGIVGVGVTAVLVWLVPNRP